MKPGYLTFLLFVITACVSHETKEALDRAEKMLSQEPDKARIILDSIPRQELTSRSVRARHALLSTSALDKCQIEIKEDSAIVFASEWYQNHGPKLYGLMSKYYLGIVQSNAGNDFDAAISFRKAESAAIRLHEYRWQSLCDQHLSDIYSRHFDRIVAMSYARQSLRTAQWAGDSLMAGYCRLDIADQYIAQTQMDSAEVLLKEILETWQDRVYLYSYACRSLAKLYLFKPNPEYDMADSCYARFLSRGVIPLSCQDYGHLGLLAEHRKNARLSDYYCSMAEQAMVSALDSVTYYVIRRNIEELRGDYRASSAADRMAMDIQDRIVYKQLEQSLSHAMEVYYQNQAELEKEKGRTRLYVFILVGAFLFALIFWLTNRLFRTRREVLEKMAQIQDFSREYDTLLSRESDSQVLIDYYSKDKIRSLNGLADAYFSWDSEQVRQKEKRTGVMSKEEMVEEFRKQLEMLRKDKLFYASLEKSLNVSSNNIMARAREELRSAKRVDYDLLLLFFSGFSAKSICFLKDMTEASVRMRKTRIKQYFAALPDNRGVEFVKKIQHEDLR